MRQLRMAGGHFFSVIFAGTTIGFDCAILAGADPVLCVNIGADTVVGGVMRKPVLAILPLLRYPITTVPVMLTAAFAASLVPLPKSVARARGLSNHCSM